MGEGVDVGLLVVAVATREPPRYVPLNHAENGTAYLRRSIFFFALAFAAFPVQAFAQPKEFGVDIPYRDVASLLAEFGLSGEFTSDCATTDKGYERLTSKPSPTGSSDLTILRLVDGKPKEMSYFIANGRLETNELLSVVLMPYDTGNIVTARIVRQDGAYRLDALITFGATIGPATTRTAIGAYRLNPRVDYNSPKKPPEVWDGYEGSYAHQWVRACRPAPIG